MVLKTQDLYRKWDTLFPEILQDFKGIMVGCSAGLDSTVLFHLLCDYYQEKKFFSLALCHVNFGLRPNENIAEANFLQTLAQNKDVPCFVHEISEKPQKNVQAWARDLRFGVFLDY